MKFEIIVFLAALVGSEIIQIDLPKPKFFSRKEVELSSSQAQPRKLSNRIIQKDIKKFKNLIKELKSEKFQMLQLNDIVNTVLEKINHTLLKIEKKSSDAKTTVIN